MWNIRASSKRGYGGEGEGEGEGESGKANLPPPFTHLTTPFETLTLKVVGHLDHVVGGAEAIRHPGCLRSPKVGRNFVERLRLQVPVLEVV